MVNYSPSSKASFREEAPFREVQIAKACAYSEYPATLRKLLRDIIDIQIDRTGIHARYFGPDDPSRMILRVTLSGKTAQKPYSYDFGMSIHDTAIIEGEGYNLPYESGKRKKSFSALHLARQKVLEDQLYSVLACIGGDISCPEAFDDFCRDYGYDEDSRKALDLYEKCHKHARELRRIIPQRFRRALPA